MCNRRFDQLRDHQAGTLMEGLRFNFFNNFVVRQTPDLMAFALRMLYAMGFSDAQVLLGNSTAGPTGDTGGSGANKGGGSGKNKVIGTGSSRDLSSTGEYLQQTVTRTFTSFGDAFELQETIGNFMGTLVNVTDTMCVDRSLLYAFSWSPCLHASLSPLCLCVVASLGVSVSPSFFFTTLPLSV